MILALLAPLAAADEPYEEVVVTGERLQQAEQTLVEQLHDHGYAKIVRIGQRTYWVTPQLWRPWVMVDAEGFARYRGVRLVPVGPYRRLPDQPDAPVAGATFATQSARQAKGQKERLADEIEPYLSEIRDAKWAVARAQRALQLQADLVALWFDGIAPDGRSIEGARDRRDAIVALWLHTEPDRDGQRVRDQISGFVDEHVQTVDPYTAEEITAANAARTFEDAFAPQEGP